MNDSKVRSVFIVFGSEFNNLELRYKKRFFKPSRFWFLERQIVGVTVSVRVKLTVRAIETVRVRMRVSVRERDSRLFSTLPIAAKRKNTLGKESHEVSFMPPFWLGFYKQRKRAGGRRSSKHVFFTFPHRGETKTTLGNESHEVGFMPPFWLGTQKVELTMGVQTRFFDFPHRGKTKKQHWERIPRGQFHGNILAGLSKQRKKSG